MLTDLLYLQNALGKLFRMVSWGSSRNKGLGDHTYSASSVRNEEAFNRLFEIRYWSVDAYLNGMDWKKCSLLRQCPFCPSPMTLDPDIADNKCLYINTEPIDGPWSRYYLIKSSEYKINEHQYAAVRAVYR